MNTTLLVRRHAATSWNIEKRLQGRKDIALSEAGLSALEAVRIPEEYRSVPWYCSPLTRTKQTAAALGLNAMPAPGLIEMDWGDWEGQTIKELRSKLGKSMYDEESRGLDLQPPNGESPRQVRERILRWLDSLPNADVIGLITHKGVIRVMLSAASGWDMKQDCPCKPDWNKTVCFTWDRRTGLSSNVINLDW